MSATNIPQALLKQARKTGVINLPNRGLVDIPSVVWNLNKPPSQDTGFNDTEERWWEFVELTKLNAASNQISSISEEIINFPLLANLDFHDNKLKSLPEALSKLENLKKVDFSHNTLDSMPNLESSKTILVLLLQHNKITEFKLHNNSMLHCELLDLSHNALTQLSPQVNEMMRLRSLVLSNNNLSSIPMLLNLKQLTVLNLNNNQLKSLPDCFDSFPSLKQLYARNNKLENLPDLSSCGSLVEVYLGNNSLTTFPHNMGKSVCILELRDNKINEVPQTITSLEKLERLDIVNNNVSKLPPELGNMPMIKVISLDGNPLRSIRRDVINRGTQAVLKHLKSRIVTSDVDNVVSESALPQSHQANELHRKHELSSTGKLKLTSESETEIEKRLLDASAIPLTEIFFSRCSLTHVPDQIISHKNSLTVLNVSSNKIVELSSDICVLVHLTHANFSNNNLSHLPKQFQSLTSLREVNLSNNRFKEIPDCLFDMKQLEHLFADGNQITSIPAASFQSLDNLLTLSLQNNNISSIPPQIVQLKKLQTLKLEGNTFRVPRQSIVQKGSAAVIEYLRSRLPTT